MIDKDTQLFVVLDHDDPLNFAAEYTRDGTDVRKQFFETMKYDYH